MLSIVNDGKLIKKSDDINEIRRWLRFHGLEVSWRGWDGVNKFGAIYYDGATDQSDTKWRGVIWLK